MAALAYFVHLTTVYDAGSFEFGQKVQVRPVVQTLAAEYLAAVSAMVSAEKHRERVVASVTLRPGFVLFPVRMRGFVVRHGRRVTDDAAASSWRSHCGASQRLLSRPQQRTNLRVVAARAVVIVGMGVSRENKTTRTDTAGLATVADTALSQADGVDAEIGVESWRRVVDGTKVLCQIVTGRFVIVWLLGDRFLP